MTWAWTLAVSDCTGCGICVDVCDFHALEMPRAAALPRPVPGACTGCMECVHECPFGAVKVTEGAACCL